MSSGSFDTKERVKQAVDIVDLVGSHHPTAPSGPQLRRPLPLARRHPAQPAGQSRAAVVQVLGVRHRRRRLQLRDEDRGGRVPRGPGDAGRSGGHCRRKAAAARIIRRAVPAGEAATVRTSRDGRWTSGADRRQPKRQANAVAGDGLGRKAISRCLLHPPEAEPPGAISQERGITAESIERFHLGFSPLERDWILRQQAEGDGERPRRMASAGRRSWRRSAFSLGRPRAAAITIASRAGCCFRSATPRGGRWASAAGCCRKSGHNQSRRNTSIRRKRRCSPRANCSTAWTWPARRCERTRTALVMEGYTDVIVAHQYGFQNAVAVLGTALGESHIRC